ncbi:MAG: hypothetical protein ACJARI_000041 [Bacteroidia bacterium]|jgi:hypothetical protein
MALVRCACDKPGASANAIAAASSEQRLLTTGTASGNPNRTIAIVSFHSVESPLSYVLFGVSSARREYKTQRLIRESNRESDHQAKQWQLENRDPRSTIMLIIDTSKYMSTLVMILCIL